MAKIVLIVDIHWIQYCIHFNKAIQSIVLLIPSYISSNSFWILIFFLLVFWYNLFGFAVNFVASKYPTKYFPPFWMTLKFLTFAFLRFFVLLWWMKETSKMFLQKMQKNFSLHSFRMVNRLNMAPYCHHRYGAAKVNFIEGRTFCFSYHWVNIFHTSTSTRQLWNSSKDLATVQPHCNTKNILGNPTTCQSIQ